jgi:hypothetical protein
MLEPFIACLLPLDAFGYNTGGSALCHLESTDEFDELDAFMDDFSLAMYRINNLMLSICRMNFQSICMTILSSDPIAHKLNERIFASLKNHCITDSSQLSTTLHAHTSSESITENSQKNANSVLVSIMRLVCFVSRDMDLYYSDTTNAYTSRQFRYQKQRFRETVRRKSHIAKLLQECVCPGVVACDAMSNVLPLSVFDSISFNSNLVYGVLKPNPNSGSGWLPRKSQKCSVLPFAVTKDIMSQFTSLIKTNDLSTAYFCNIIRLNYEVQVLIELMRRSKQLFTNYKFPVAFSVPDDSKVENARDLTHMTLDEEFSLACVCDNELQERLGFYKQRVQVSTLFETCGLDVMTGIKPPTVQECNQSYAWVNTLQCELQKRNESLHTLETYEINRLQNISNDLTKLLLLTSSAIHLQNERVFNSLSPWTLRHDFRGTAEHVLSSFFNTLYGHERRCQTHKGRSAVKSRTDNKLLSYLAQQSVYAEFNPDTPINNHSSQLIEKTVLLDRMESISNARLTPDNGKDVQTYCMCFASRVICSVPTHRVHVVKCNTKTRKIRIMHEIVDKYRTPERQRFYYDDIYMNPKGTQIQAAVINQRAHTKPLSQRYEHSNCRVVSQIPAQVLQEVRHKGSIDTLQRYMFCLEKHTDEHDRDSFELTIKTM